MKRTILFLFFAFTGLLNYAQEAPPVLDEQRQKNSNALNYRESFPHTNNVVHTKLDVSFDFDQSQMNGKAWVTLQPHFYETDSLTVDAKGMIINEISLIKGNSRLPLQFHYDSLQLHIKLDKTYKGGEKYTVYFDYVARPNELKVQGSAAITDAKGLYFINPKGEKPGPTQIWTQGETESSSVWFPTIDKPNQKSTQEISMTVPDKYITLSNGLLVKSEKLKNNLRKDTWKMELPHAPYLFFMGVGDFAIVKDKYKNIEVSYYVEKEYEKVARGIFGETPAMMAFFEKITGVPYIWSKYSQMVGRDYVSGAMENTTATLHQESAYQNERELTDGNRWEGTIAHELFHHWFGDLVTAESWSNLTLNESFANYSEYLWYEHRYGKDKADDEAVNETAGYLQSEASHKHLVRFYYDDKEDMFDAVSYNKGGRIMHMLRTYVGDSAFFKALNLYLNTHKFGTAEAHDLRLAFEKVTGRDMNWFWNQWYFGAGEPHVTISYDYADGRQAVVIQQTQEGGLFKLPISIDIYSSEKNKKRYDVWAQNASDTFYFETPKPVWVNVDAQKATLAVKKDEKPLEWFVHQYKNGANYMDRREALEGFANAKSEQLLLGLTDSYAGLRAYTLNLLQLKNMVGDAKQEIENMARKEVNKKAKADALRVLALMKDSQYKGLYEANITDSSYSVAGAALLGLAQLDPEESYTLAKKYSNDARGDLAATISSILFTKGNAEDFDLLLNFYQLAPLDQNKFQSAFGFANYLQKVKDPQRVRKGADEIMKLIKMLPEDIREFVYPRFKPLFESAATTQKNLGNKEAAEYLLQLIP